MAYLINKYPVVKLISVNVTFPRISTINKNTQSRKKASREKKSYTFRPKCEMVTELATVRAHLKVAPRAHL